MFVHIFLQQRHDAFALGGGGEVEGGFALSIGEVKGGADSEQHADPLRRPAGLA